MGSRSHERYALEYNDSKMLEIRRIDYESTS